MPAGLRPERLVEEHEARISTSDAIRRRGTEIVALPCLLSTLAFTVRVRYEERGCEPMPPAILSRERRRGPIGLTLRTGLSSAGSPSGACVAEDAMRVAGPAIAYGGLRSDVAPHARTVK
jgi:hypothetical protein